MCLPFRTLEDRTVCLPFVSVSHPGPPVSSTQPGSEQKLCKGVVGEAAYPKHPGVRGRRWPLEPNMLLVSSASSLFICWVLAALCLRCCTQAFSSCSERWLLYLQFAGFSLQWLLLLWSIGFRCIGFSNCSTQALRLWLEGLRVQAQ